MKKFLAVMLTMLLFVLTAAMMVSSASAAVSTYPSKTRNEVNRMSDYQGVITGSSLTTMNQINQKFTQDNELDFFDSKNSQNWTKNAGLTIPANPDSTAMMQVAGTMGHVFDNEQFGFGTFELKFNVQFNDVSGQPEKYYSDNFDNLPGTFFGILFMQSVEISNTKAIESPWTTHGGYPYMITFDCEQGPTAGNTGVDGGTLNNGDTLIEGRPAQTGLSLRRYPSSGSHNYTRWATVKPTNAIYTTSVPNKYESKIPAYAKEVRVEDIWDGEDHVMTCQFIPLYADNEDGIDAMLIEVYYDSVLVLRVYDEMPFRDIEQREVTNIDKRLESDAPVPNEQTHAKGDGYVMFWNHHAQLATAQMNTREDYRVNITSFKIKNYGASKDLNPTWNDPVDLEVENLTHQYNRNAVELIPTRVQEGASLEFTDEKGNVIAGSKYVDGDGNPLLYPKFTDAGTYTVNVKASQRGFKATIEKATVTITKGRSTLTAPFTQRVDYTGEFQKISASVGTGDNVLKYSPSEGGFTDMGYYRVVVWAEETDNYLAITPRVVTFIIGDMVGTVPDVTFDEMCEIEGRLLMTLDSDVEFEFDGLEHCLWVNNLYPGAAVSYTMDFAGEPVSSAVDPGTYTLTAIVSKPGFESKLIETTFTIKPAVNSIEAEDTQIFYYTGQSFKAYGVTSSGMVVYSTSSYSEIGTYTTSISYGAATKSVTVKIIEYTGQ